MNFLVIPICVGIVGSVQVVKHENTTYFLEGYTVKCRPAPSVSETTLPEPVTSTELPGLDQDPPELDFSKANAASIGANGERACNLQVSDDATIYYYSTVKCSEGSIKYYRNVTSLEGKSFLFGPSENPTVRSDEGRIILRKHDEKSDYNSNGFQLFLSNAEELQEGDKLLVENVKRCFDKDNYVTIAPECP